jgi:hypothetical protein
LKPGASYVNVTAIFGEPDNIAWLDRDVRRFGNSDIASVQYSGITFIVTASRQTMRMKTVANTLANKVV